jgi:hypothetical protein
VRWSSFLRIHANAILACDFAPAEVRAYLRMRFTELLTAPNFLDVLPGMIFPDGSLAERTQVVADRIRLLAQQDKG